MEYCKTQTRKCKETDEPVNYYKIELYNGDMDPDFNSLPEHWKDAIWKMEGEKKSNRSWPDQFYCSYKLGRMGMEGKRLENGIWIDWNWENDNTIKITWSGQPLEDAYKTL
tara:strand:- start:44 stop:376 length:333 start_codon:yes stop_codon:yes gene_type:complete